MTTLTNGIALAMNCLHDMNSTRRQSMKKDLHRDYAALCNDTTVPSSSEFLFGDLSKLTKDISDANHNAALPISAPTITRTGGLALKNYIFSEANSGKDVCNRKIAPLKAHITRYLNEGDK